MPALTRISLGQNALAPDRRDFLQSILDQTKFPGMNDIRRLVDLLTSEIERSGEVRVQEGTIVNRAGKEVTSPILVIGNFTAAYRLPEETGFLIYSDTSERLFALSRLPKSRVSGKIEQYMDGKSDDVPIDITFSRLYKLDNSYRLDFENGQIRGRLFDPVRLQVLDGNGNSSITAGEPCLYQQYARRLVENFVDVVAGSQQPLFTAKEVAPSISVLEEGYRRAIPFELPWYRDDPNIRFLCDSADADRTTECEND